MLITFGKEIKAHTVSIWGAKIFLPSNNDWWEILSSRCKVLIGRSPAIKQIKQSQVTKKSFKSSFLINRVSSLLVHINNVDLHCAHASVQKEIQRNEIVKEIDENKKDAEELG